MEIFFKELGDFATEAYFVVDWKGLCLHSILFDNGGEKKEYLNK